MILVEFALGLLVLALVTFAIVKLADKLGVVELIRSWFKK